MSTPSPQDVTRMLTAIGQGDAHAAERLLPLVYEELRRLAHLRMAHEPPGHTLQPTALVHEAYMRLIGHGNVRWQNRAHFFGAAAQAMRRILVERARKKAAAKYGAGIQRVALDDVAVENPEQVDLIALERAMARLEVHDKRMSAVVMLRFYAGLSLDETARALGLSRATVKREWDYAKAWLHHELTRGQEAPHEEDPGG